MEWKFGRGGAVGWYLDEEMGDGKMDVGIEIEVKVGRVVEPEPEVEGSIIIICRALLAVVESLVYRTYTQR